MQQTLENVTFIDLLEEYTFTDRHTTTRRKWTHSACCMYVCSSYPFLWFSSPLLPLRSSSYIPPPTPQSSCINRHVNLAFGSSLSIAPSRSRSHSLPALFSSVCFHSSGFRVITWHLQCKVPCVHLRRWLSFISPADKRGRKRKRVRKGGLQQGVMLFWQDMGTLPWIIFCSCCQVQSTLRNVLCSNT